MKFYGFVVESDVAFNSFQVRSGQVSSDQESFLLREQEQLLLQTSVGS